MVLSRAGRLLPKLLDFGIAKRASTTTLADRRRRRRSDRPRLGARLAALHGARAVASTPRSVDARSRPLRARRARLRGADRPAAVRRRSLRELARAHAREPLPPLGAAVPARRSTRCSRARWRSEPAIATPTRSSSRPRCARRPGSARGARRCRMLDETLRARWSPTRRSRSPRRSRRSRPRATPHQARDALCDWSPRRSRAGSACSRSPVARAPARVGDDAAGARRALRALRRRALADDEWLELARELCRPFAARARRVPDARAGRRALSPATGARRSAPHRSRCARRRRRIAALPRDRGARELAACMPTLARCSRGSPSSPTTRWSSRAAALPSAGWACAARTPRRRARVDGATADGEPLLLDADGAPVARARRRWSRSRAPAPGAPAELFLLEGAGRHGARARRHARRLRAPRRAAWDWLRQHLLDVERPRRRARSTEERAPYRGLSSFTPRRRRVFFGREREVEAFVNRLRAQPLLAVVGPSGAGKSSFVQAGVIPALPAGWRAVTVRPGARRSRRCARASRAQVGRRRRARRRVGRGDCARARRARRALVLVVDQLEELFTLVRATPTSARASPSAGRARRAPPTIRCASCSRCATTS